MPKMLFPYLLSFCMVSTMYGYAQQKSTTLIRSTLEDESIWITIDKLVYFPGDTVRLTIQRTDKEATSTVSPAVEIEGTTLKAADDSTYVAVIPHQVTPGSYRVRLRVLDAQARRFVYETDCVVVVEEYQSVEQISNYVSITPQSGSSDPHKAVTLEIEEIRNLQVQFRRDGIQSRMGPQFVTVRTAVQLRDGNTIQVLERRVMTFRSHGNPERDRSMFIQYRKAYGAYAAISTEELERVRLPLDSLPAWALVKVTVEPDYTIRIGAYDRSNSLTRYFRVRGPTIEIGFSLGIPKVLYDTQAKDTVEYGNTSAILRFYYINSESGNRFPVSFGIGTFGVSSPIDVGVGRGGFAFPVFLDFAELMRKFDIELIKKINLGLELTPFISIGKKPRLLFNAQVSLVI